MLEFKIEEKKCIECALCAQDCPVSIIEMKPKPIIREEREHNCLKCQHCMAICPTSALSILGKKPEDCISVKGEMPKAESLSRMIKTRRSIRKYKQEDLDQNLIQELLEIAAYAPTGHNDNAVLISLIDNRTDLHLFREKIYDAIKQAKKNGTLPKQHDLLAYFQRMWENNGTDVLFRDAPHIIIASAPASDASPMADCMISLSYFELMANTKGVGTLWNGLIKWVLDDISPELRTSLGIPEDHLTGYVMLFGNPAVKYARGIQSEGLQINRIKLSE